MHTKQKLYEQLETFRSAVGHHVHVHSSLRAVGEVEDRGEGLLDCLIGFFTQEGGMVSFPTHTWDKNMLDTRKQETCMGMLSKLALQREDGVRTLNPTHSMVIFGERAAAYAKWDEGVVTSVPATGCYGKLYDEDGYVLLMGVGQNKNTYIHAAEEALDVPERNESFLSEAYIIDREGKRQDQPMHLLYEEKGDISHFFSKLEPAFRYHHCILDGKIGDAPVQLCSVRKMYAVLAMLHERSDYKEFLTDDKPLPLEWYQESV